MCNMLWLTSVLYQLILYECLVRAVRAGVRVRRTIIGRYPVCPRGCTACSPINGCVSCESHLFMFLHRQNMREVGICTPSCPVGFYGVRHQYYNKCYRCHIDHCYSCFSRQYCTLCEDPYLVNEGQCIEQCPAGQYYANFTRECKDRVDCLPGAWSQWSECSRNGQNCGFKNGNQVRTRAILQDASPNGTPCPEVTETQRCRLPHRHCDGGCGNRRTHLQRKKNKWIERRRKKKKKKPNKKKMRGRGVKRGDGRSRRRGGHRKDIEKFNQVSHIEKFTQQSHIDKFNQQSHIDKFNQQSHLEKFNQQSHIEKFKQQIHLEKFKQQASPNRACRVCSRRCRRKRLRKFSNSD